MKESEIVDSSLVRRKLLQHFSLALRLNRVKTADIPKRDIFYKSVEEMNSLWKAGTASSLTGTILLVDSEFTGKVKGRTLLEKDNIFYTLVDQYLFQQIDRDQAKRWEYDPTTETVVVTAMLNVTTNSKEELAQRAKEKEVPLSELRTAVQSKKGSTFDDSAEKDKAKEQEEAEKITANAITRAKVKAEELEAKTLAEAKEKAEEKARKFEEEQLALAKERAGKKALEIESTAISSAQEKARKIEDTALADAKTKAMKIESETLAEAKVIAEQKAAKVRSDIIKKSKEEAEMRNQKVNKLINSRGKNRDKNKQGIEKVKEEEIEIEEELDNSTNNFEDESGDPNQEYNYDQDDIDEDDEDGDDNAPKVEVSIDTFDRISANARRSYFLSAFVTNKDEVADIKLGITNPPKVNNATNYHTEHFAPIAKAFATLMKERKDKVASVIKKANESPADKREAIKKEGLYQDCPTKNNKDKTAKLDSIEAVLYTMNKEAEYSTSRDLVRKYDPGKKENIDKITRKHVFAPEVTLKVVLGSPGSPTTALIAMPAAHIMRPETITACYENDTTALESLAEWEKAVDGVVKNGEDYRPMSAGLVDKLKSTMPYVVQPLEYSAFKEYIILIGGDIYEDPALAIKKYRQKKVSPDSKDYEVKNVIGSGIGYFHVEEEVIDKLVVDPESPEAEPTKEFEIKRKVKFYLDETKKEAGRQIVTPNNFIPAARMGSILVDEFMKSDKKTLDTRTDDSFKDAQKSMTVQEIFQHAYLPALNQAVPGYKEKTYFNFLKNMKGFEIAIDKTTGLLSKDCNFLKNLSSLPVENWFNKELPAEMAIPTLKEVPIILRTLGQKTSKDSDTGVESMTTIIRTSKHSLLDSIETGEGGYTIADLKTYASFRRIEDLNNKAWTPEQIQFMLSIVDLSEGVVKAQELKEASIASARRMTNDKASLTKLKGSTSLWAKNA